MREVEDRREGGRERESLRERERERERERVPFGGKEEAHGGGGD